MKSFVWLTFLYDMIYIYMEVPVTPKQLRTEYAELDKRGRLAGFFYLKLQMSNFLFSFFNQFFCSSVAVGAQA